jgi:KDO2-lipid IV(A) lauroyltransferase
MNSLAYVCVKIVTFIVRVLPRRLALGLGALCGRLAWLAGIRRGVTLVNLQIALGDDVPDREKKRVAARSYAEMGRTLIDFLRLPLLTNDRWRGYITIEGEGNLRDAAAEGKGLIFMTGHLGCWELIPVVLSGLGYAPNLVVRRLRNPVMNDFCNGLRHSSGAKVIPVEDIARGVLGALRRGEPVGILPDQNVKSDGVFVDFFGVPASTAAGAAAFAMRTGAPIVPCFMIREDGGHRMVIEPPAAFERTGDRQRDLEEPTRRVTAVIESYIRKYPDRYFWMHRRWKTRPSGKTVPYTYEDIMGSGRNLVA